MHGGPGAPTPPSTCGLRPERTGRRRHQRHSFHIDHLAGHAAVDDEIGAADEAGALAVEEPEDDLGDVLRLADAAGRVLRMILAAQRALILCLDPAGTDAVDADIRSEADSERVSERDDTALRGRIGFGAPTSFIETTGFFGACGKLPPWQYRPRQKTHQRPPLARRGAF
jgi:hypothetical protein